MTTAAPDGAYIIGGGTYHFGQTLTEDLARAAFEFPVPTPANMLELLQTVLATLPFDALKPFKDFLGMDDAHWQSISEAVEAIMQSLQQRPIIATIIGIIAELERITGLDFSHGPVEFLISLFKAITDGTGLDFGNGPIAFLVSLFAAITKATGLDFGNGPIAFLKSLFDAISNATGLDFSNGPVAFLASLVTVIVTEVTKFMKPFFDGITGIANATWQQAVAAVTKISTDLQSFVNGIISAFGGTGSTITAAINAITSWLTNIFQKLVDGIGNLFFPTATNRPVLDAINAIGGIFGVATNADTSASQANAAIEAIKAGQQGGYSDEFEIPAATSLTADWKKLSAIQDTYGPDGAGSAVGKMVGTGTGWIQYCNTGKPLSGNNMKITATLSALPWWDVFVKSGWMLTVQNNATDQSCYGVIIEQTAFKFFTMSPSGVITDLGGLVTMPTWSVGVPYALEVKGTTLTFYRNGIVQGTRVVSNALAGTMVGFGGHKSPYTSTDPNGPVAKFAGISWQPVT